MTLYKDSTVNFELCNHRTYCSVWFLIWHADAFVLLNFEVLLLLTETSSKHVIARTRLFQIMHI